MASTPEEHLDVAKEILGRFFPWEAERCASIELTDANGVLTGRFSPTVREPVAVLPSGAAVLGVGDVVVLNDPITGQGSNNAAKCAATYLAAILEHGDLPFDAAWMRATFERFWQQAEPVTRWTNALLAPAEPHMLELLGAATGSAEVASRFVNGFDDPADFDQWFMEAGKARAYLDGIAR